MKRAKAILWGLLLLLGVNLPGRAALQFDVFAGYDGIIREAGWFPITCEVFNDGPSFNAIIRVSSGQFGAEQMREFPVELPTNTRKRLVIPMFASGNRFNVTWDGELLDSNRKKIQERRGLQTQSVAWESALMGALPRNFGGTPAFPEVTANRQDLKPQVARFTVEQFPDNPISLEGLDTIYLNSEKAPDLKENQVTALLGWVRAGGHLIVAVEQVADVNGTRWLKEFLPMELADSRQLKLDQEMTQWLRTEPSGAELGDETGQLGGTVGGARGPRRSPEARLGSYANAPLDTDFRNAEMPVATGSLRDGYVLLSAQASPLAVQAPRGRGKITLLNFSPEREPFRGWKARPFFWAKLSGIPGEFFTEPNQAGWGGSSIDGVFGALIDSRQIKKLPVTWLLVLLIVYLVVIGPFDHWWLKKIGRQMLTWITFPSYVVLFSLLIYFIGYKLRAGETEWNELNVVDVLPRGDKVDLRGRSYISIYSSANASYPITGQEGHATLRGELLDFQSGGREGSKARVEHQGNSYKAEVDVPVWTSSLYASDWFQTNQTPFLAAVSDTGTDYQVDVENLLDRPLTELRLVVGQLLFDLEPLPAGERRTVRLAPSAGKPLRGFVQENGAFFQRAIELRRNPLGDTSGGRLEDRPLTATTASFTSYLSGLTQGGRGFITPAGLDLSAQIERGDAVLFAWLPNFSFAGKINQFQPPRFQQDTLLRLTVPVRSASKTL